MVLKASEPKSVSKKGSSKAKKELDEATKMYTTVAEELDAFREENEAFFIVLDKLTEKQDAAVEAAKLAARIVYLEVNKANKGSNILVDEQNFMVSVTPGGWNTDFDLATWREECKKKSTEFPKEPFFVKSDPKFDAKKFDEEIATALKSDQNKFKAMQKFNSYIKREPKTPKVTMGHPDDVLTKKAAQKRALQFAKGV